MNDEQAMDRAIQLALRGTGKVSPNPRVGCVIIRQGRIIGEGWHDHYGGPHAEVVALNNARESVDGATMIVTLEPCNHQGKQPPCTDAILATKRSADGSIDPQRGIQRVVVGMRDPNTRVRGGGIERLREAGIIVDVGVRRQQCEWLNRFFVKYVARGMPYIIGKAALSLDGCIAAADGTSKWISCQQSRRRGHALRAEVDAVLIGRRTAEIDDPQLGARMVGGIVPRRIVLDSNLSLDPTLQLLNDKWSESTIVCCSPEAASSERAKLLRIQGVNVLGISRIDDYRLNLEELFRRLGAEFSLGSILVEGGGKVLSYCLEQNLLDELHLFYAPIVLGDGLGVFDDCIVPSLDRAARWQYHAVIRSGDDLHCVLLPVRQQGTVL